MRSVASSRCLSLAIKGNYLPLPWLHQQNDCPKVDRGQFFSTLAASTTIEIVWASCITWPCILALGYSPSWPAAFIGYIVMVGFDPPHFLRGQRRNKYRLPTFAPVWLSHCCLHTITLLFRLFNFGSLCRDGGLLHQGTTSSCDSPYLSWYGQHYFCGHTGHACPASAGEEQYRKRSFPPATPPWCSGCVAHPSSVFPSSETDVARPVKHLTSTGFSMVIGTC